MREVIIGYVAICLVLAVVACSGLRPHEWTSGDLRQLPIEIQREQEALRHGP